MKKELSNSNDTLTKLNYLSDSLNISGYCTYYCYPGQKRITASGIPFNENKFTCAFYLGVSDEVERNETKQERINRKRKYLGKKILITSKDTQIVALVTDNGSYMEYPYKSRNIIADLTPSLFRALGGDTKDGRIKATIKLL